MENVLVSDGYKALELLFFTNLKFHFFFSL